MARSALSLNRSIDRSSPELDDSALPTEAAETGTARRILLAGMELFADRGYHGTSIRDVAERAGVKSATLYTHFASKEEILARLVFIGHDVHHRSLLDATLEAGREPVDQLRAVMRVHVRMHCRYSSLAVVATRERRHLSEAALAPAAALRRRSEDLVAQIVARGIEHGTFRVEDYETTLVAIGSMGVAVADWYPDRATALAPDDVAEAYARLALRMVGSPA